MREGDHQERRVLPGYQGRLGFGAEGRRGGRRDCRLPGVTLKISFARTDQFASMALIGSSDIGARAWASSRHNLTALCAARRRRRLIMVSTQHRSTTRDGAPPCRAGPAPTATAPRLRHSGTSTRTRPARGPAPLRLANEAERSTCCLEDGAVGGLGVRMGRSECERVSTTATNGQFHVDVVNFAATCEGQGRTPPSVVER